MSSKRSRDARDTRGNQPKKGKGGASSSKGKGRAPSPPPPLSPTSIWRTKISTWEPVKERWMAFDNDASAAKYFDIINFHTIGALVKKPNDARMDVVREFILGLKDTEGTFSLIKDKKVYFHSYNINRLYQIEDVPPGDDALQPMLKWPKDDSRFYEIEHTLCQGMAFEYYAKKSGTIFKNYFSQEAQVWRLFLQGRVFSTTNFRECTRYHQLILFCLLTKKKFDVGTVIENEIKELRKKVQKGESGTLMFPSLITLLCEKSGIPMVGSLHQKFTKIGTKDLKLTTDVLQPTVEFWEQYWGNSRSSDWNQPIYVPRSLSPLELAYDQNEENDSDNNVPPSPNVNREDTQFHDASSSIPTGPEDGLATKADLLALEKSMLASLHRHLDAIAGMNARNHEIAALDRRKLARAYGIPIENIPPMPDFVYPPEDPKHWDRQ